MEHATHSERDNSRTDSDTLDVSQNLLLNTLSERVVGKFDAEIFAILYKNAF